MFCRRAFVSSIVQFIVEKDDQSCEIVCQSRTESTTKQTHLTFKSQRRDDGDAARHSAETNGKSNDTERARPRTSFDALHALTLALRARTADVDVVVALFDTFDLLRVCRRQ